MCMGNDFILGYILKGFCLEIIICILKKKKPLIRQSSVLKQKLLLNSVQQ